MTLKNSLTTFPFLQKTPPNLTSAFVMLRIKGSRQKIAFFYYKEVKMKITHGHITHVYMGEIIHVLESNLGKVWMQCLHFILLF